VRVRFDLNGSTARVRPARLVPVLLDRLRAGDAPAAAAAAAAAEAMARLDCGECSRSGEDRTAAAAAAGTAAAGQNARLAIVASSTDDFRRMARSQVARDDSVLEIGCSAGGATIVLAQQASSVVGVDVSHELLEQVCFWAERATQRPQHETRDIHLRQTHTPHPPFNKTKPTGARTRGRAQRAA
jgi:SAM-dependent methyltransferase